MKKQRKNKRHEKSNPEQDHFLMRIKQGERMYKFYYFGPMAGRHNHFEYRILTKEKVNGTLEAGLIGRSRKWLMHLQDLSKLNPGTFH